MVNPDDHTIRTTKFLRVAQRALTVYETEICLASQSMQIYVLINVVASCATI